MDSRDYLLHKRWKAALEATKSGDHQSAIQILTSLADEQIWEAFVELGSLFHQAKEDVADRFQHALHWYRRAVFEADDPWAHLGLAIMYFNGQGVAIDHSKVDAHCLKVLAATPPRGVDVRGRILAILMLGKIYRDGTGHTRDLGGAYKLYEEGLREGFPAIIRECAQLEYERGHFLRGTYLVVKAISLAFGLAIRDKQDPRLTGIPTGSGSTASQIPSSPMTLGYRQIHIVK